MNIHCIFSKAFSEIQIRVLSLSKMKDIAGAAERFESATFVLTVVRVVDLRQLVVAYVGRISLKREPQVNKPAVRASNYYLYKNFRHSTHTGIRTAELSVLLSLKVPHRCTRHCNKGCVQLRVMPSPRRRCVLQKRGRLQACRQERMCGDLDRAKPSSSARIQIPQPSGFCPRGATSRRMPVQTHR